MDARDNKASKARLLALRLDPGLAQEAGRDRLARLRHNLRPRDASLKELDMSRLETLGSNLASGAIRLSHLLQQYYATTDPGRWPIVAVQPQQPDLLRQLERELVATGFTMEPSLASAYRKVSLLPVRIPPEPAVVEALALLDHVARVERSWLTGSMAELIAADDRPITHPDNLLDRDLLPSELLSKRDPLRIGLIDSGIDATHPALQTRLLDQRAFRRGMSAVGDQLGHGTATGGIIARLCTAATFLSAKVVDTDRRANLDDLIRAIGWLKKHRPDLVVCNVLLPIPASGASVLSSMLRSLVDDGIIVIVPSMDGLGEIATPGNTPGVVSVATAAAAAASPVTTRVIGHHVLAPRGMQAKDALFPRLDYPNWTIISGPAAAAAIAAGTAGLLLRVARFCRHEPAAGEIVDNLLRGQTNGLLDPGKAVNEYLLRLTHANPQRAEVSTAPMLGALDSSSRAPTHPLFVEESTAISEELPPELQGLLAPDSDLTQPLDEETKRALAALEARRDRERAAEDSSLGNDSAATVQGRIPEHILKLAGAADPGTVVDEEDRPEWWPETEEISIDSRSDGEP